MEKKQLVSVIWAGHWASGQIKAGELPQELSEQTQRQSGSWGQGEANAEAVFWPQRQGEVLGFVNYQAAEIALWE